MTKTIRQDGLAIMKAILAFILAFAMCVPAMGLSGVQEAWAAGNNRCFYCGNAITDKDNYSTSELRGWVCGNHSDDEVAYGAVSVANSLPAAYQGSGASYASPSFITIVEKTADGSYRYNQDFLNSAISMGFEPWADTNEDYIEPQEMMNILMANATSPDFSQSWSMRYNLGKKVFDDGNYATPSVVPTSINDAVIQSGDVVESFGFMLDAADVDKTEADSISSFSVAAWTLPWRLFKVTDEPINPTPATQDAYICLSSPDGILQGVEYNIYKLFDANVDMDGKASNVQATGAIRNIDLRAIEAGASKRPETAQGVDGGAIVARAYAELGKPYQWGAAGPAGFDTSGLVSYCLTGVYGQRVGTVQTFASFPQVETPLPGDIWIASSLGSCGIYIGDGQMVAALGAGRPVSITPVTAGFFVRPPAAASAPASNDEAGAISLLSDEGSILSQFGSDQEMAEFIAANIKDGDQLYKDSFGMKLAKEVAAAYSYNRIDPSTIPAGSAVAALRHYSYDYPSENEMFNPEKNEFSDESVPDFVPIPDDAIAISSQYWAAIHKAQGGAVEGDWLNNDWTGKTITIQAGDKTITTTIAGYVTDKVGYSIVLGKNISEELEGEEEAIITIDGVDLVPTDPDAPTTPEPLTTIADQVCTKVDGCGYYLIVRKDTLEGEDSVASTPLFVPVHPGENDVEIKAALPAVDKLIQEDSTDEWGKEADHSVNQTVPYKITGNVAENVDAYSTYKYIFHDVYEADRMTIDPESVKITINGEADKDITASATITFGANADGEQEMTVAFDDLYAAYPELAKTDKVVLEYSAIQTGVAAPDGIVNTVYLEYANNPVNLESTGTTPKSECVDYSYKFNIHKVDNATGASLAGAKFTIQNSVDKYIGLDENGKIIETDEPYEWTTDANGYIELDGVDVDTYKGVETEAPTSYKQMTDEFTLALTVEDRNNITASIDGSDLVKIEVPAGAEPVSGIKVDLDEGLATGGVEKYVAVDLANKLTDGTIFRQNSSIQQMCYGYNDIPYMGAEYGQMTDEQHAAFMTNALQSLIDNQDARNGFIRGISAAGSVMDWSVAGDLASGDTIWLEYDPSMDYTITPGTTAQFDTWSANWSENWEEHYMLLAPLDANNEVVDTADVILIKVKPDTRVVVDASGNVKVAGDTGSDIATVQVKNIKQIELPSTGAAGLWLLITAAIAVAVMAYCRRKKDDDVATVMYV